MALRLHEKKIMNLRFGIMLTRDLRLVSFLHYSSVFRLLYLLFRRSAVVLMLAAGRKIFNWARKLALAIQLWRPNCPQVDMKTGLLSKKSPFIRLKREFLRVWVQRQLPCPALALRISWKSMRPLKWYNLLMGYFVTSKTWNKRERDSIGQFVRKWESKRKIYNFLVIFR